MDGTMVVLIEGLMPTNTREFAKLYWNVLKGG
jgi:hypothetical protein